jgi:DNA-binding MarR family transcriptional regulator
MTFRNNISTSIRQLMEAIISRSMKDSVRYMKAAGLTWQQFGVLMRLYHHSGCGVSEIGKHMGITNAAASQLIDGLVEKGLLERIENPTDRRAKHISLSPQGHTFIEDGMKERYHWLDALSDKLSEALSPEQQQLILSAISTLTDTARQTEE